VTLPLGLTERAPVLDRVIGQPAAVTLLRASIEAPLHAYLFLGQPGTGRREAAVAFAAALFCPDGGCGVCEVCVATLAERHPDLVLVERQGAAISVPQAQEVTRLSLRSPRAAPYQVLVLVDFHLVEKAGPALLKTIEEPPDTTVIIVLAESVPPDFVTIASRCVRVEFRALAEGDVAAALVREGTDLVTADAVAQAAGGRLDRARLLVHDPGFAVRLDRWRQVPARLDGTGAAVVALAEELLEAASEPVAIVKARQGEELARLTELAEQAGERAIPGRSVVEDRHKREQRRARTDELRAGLAALGATYRGRLESLPQHSAMATQIRAIELLDQAAERLQRNVNETLLLEWLLLRLDRLV
jgi:DNA polymerase-3 subunit delta'